MKDFLKELEGYRTREIEVYQRLNLEDVNKVINVLEDARETGKHIFICGNGGSAATASHYAGDFNKGVNMGLAGIDGHALSPDSPSADMMSKSSVDFYNFECLSDNQPTALAVANDESYDEVFRYPLSVKMQEGDIVIGISGSGNSANVVNALDYASSHGGTTIAIVGYDGGVMKSIADHCIHVQINDMQVSEDVHMFLDHLMMWVLTH